MIGIHAITELTHFRKVHNISSTPQTALKHLKTASQCLKTVFKCHKTAPKQTGLRSLN